MKDITRIHIAKTPYSIELAAKKELETYIAALETYAADHELLNDIEIRITELLLEQGVKPEDVISLDDIVAVRKQLGEPKDFMADGEVQDTNAELLPETEARPLYRNLDTALLGGVLGGIASYLRIDAVWIRLIFVILFFVSAGLLGLLYIVAWLIVPPARTAAEKLQMNGRAVTLASIRELNESGLSAETEKRQAFIRRVLSTALGASALFAALGGLAIMAIAAMQILLGQDFEMGDGYRLPLVLMFISGALFVALSLMVAFAAFAQKFNKRIWISAIVIIIAGLATFTAAIGGVYFSERSEYAAHQRNMIETTDNLPTDFTGVKTLTVDIPDNASLMYIVDTSAPTLKQRLHKDASQAAVTVEGDKATISLPASDHFRHGGDALITLRGPALESLTATHGHVSYESDNQSQLTIQAKNDSFVSLDNARMTTLLATVQDGASLEASNASVATADLTMSDASHVSLGNIKTLRVQSPDSCAATTTAQLNVESILDATFSLNDTQTAVRATDNPCFTLAIGHDEDRED